MFTEMEVKSEVISVSLVIIARNEAGNLPRCLESVQGWVQEIIVVINDCTDNTREIAESFHARVIEHTWEGYSAQKNFAYQQAQCEWILKLDADEVVSYELKTSILRFIKSKQAASCVVATCRKINRYLNHWMWHTARNRNIALLVKKGAVTWEGDVHEKLVYQGKTCHLSGDLWHYTETSVQQTFLKQIHYAQLASKTIVKKYSKTQLILKAILDPLGNFLQKYVLQCGFLDGFAGFYYSVSNAFYSFCKYLFAYEKKMRTNQSK